MYGKHVRNLISGETGIVVARPIKDCPNLSIAPDRDPQKTICWPKTVCQVVTR